MKQFMSKQPVAILSIMLFSVAIMLSGNTNAAEDMATNTKAARDMATQAELNAAVAKLNAKIKALTPPKRAIGDELPSGGVVFWVDSTGRHGLAVSGDDQAANWYEAHDEVRGSLDADWRLPTLPECQEMTANKDAIKAAFGEGAHVAYHSWTSAEIDATTVWHCEIITGEISRKSKDSRGFILSVRRF